MKVESYSFTTATDIHKVLSVAVIPGLFPFTLQNNVPAYFHIYMSSPANTFLDDKLRPGKKLSTGAVNRCRCGQEKGVWLMT